MAERESSLDKFNRHIEKVINRQQAEMDAKIQAIDGNTPISEIITILSEANELVSFLVAGDEELYELWRYRLFTDTADGKFLIIQGNEIDVDFRNMIESGRLTENDDEDEDDAPDEDDEEW